MISNTQQNEIITKQEADGKTCSEDGLVSIQDTVVSTKVEARHSPTVGSSKKSGFKKRAYFKAVHILAKIQANEAAGKVDDRDLADKVRYSAVIEAYEKDKATNSEFNGICPRTERQVVAKRNGSVEDTSNACKRSKDSTTTSVSTKAATESNGIPPASRATSSAAGKPTYNAVLKNELYMALVDSSTLSGRRVQERWGDIEARLTEMVNDFLLSHPEEPPPLFDSSDVFRGCRLIKCEDRFSLEFLTRSVAEISQIWNGLSLQLMPAKDLPRAPVARIRITNIAIGKEKLLQCLRLQNRNLDMQDWHVLREEKPQPHGRSFLLTFPYECLLALGKQENKIRFGIRYTTLKIFSQAEAEVDIEELEEVLKATST